MNTTVYFTSKTKLSVSREIKRKLADGLVGVVMVPLNIWLWQWIRHKLTEPALIGPAAIFSLFSLAYIVGVLPNLKDAWNLLRDMKSNPISKRYLVKKLEDIDTRHTLFRYKVWFDEAKKPYYVDSQFYRSVELKSQVSFRFLPHSRVIKEWESMMPLDRDLSRQNQ